MGCSASHSLAPLSSRTDENGQDIIYSTDEYYEQARVILATIPVKRPIQRRRARSVEMPSSGVWVYWRPGWNDITQQQRRKRGTMRTDFSQATRSIKN